MSRGCEFSVTSAAAVRVVHAVAALSASDGRTVTGTGESFYGRYDVEGTLDRTGGQSYAKLRLHKLKKLKPWYYEHCYVCGSDEKSDGDLLLCDGQDGRSPASHAIDATLFPWSRRLDGVEVH